MDCLCCRSVVAVDNLRLGKVRVCMHKVIIVISSRIRNEVEEISWDISV